MPKIAIIYASGTGKTKKMAEAVASGARSDRERKAWLESLLPELARYLARWQGIVMLRGPGENVTLEKEISR